MTRVRTPGPVCAIACVMALLTAQVERSSAELSGAVAGLEMVMRDWQRISSQLDMRLAELDARLAQVCWTGAHCGELHR